MPRYSQVCFWRYKDFPALNSFLDKELEQMQKGSLQK